MDTLENLTAAYCESKRKLNLLHDQIHKARIECPDGEECVFSERAAKEAVLKEIEWVKAQWALQQAQKAAQVTVQAPWNQVQGLGQAYPQQTIGGTVTNTTIAPPFTTNTGFSTTGVMQWLQNSIATPKKP